MTGWLGAAMLHRQKHTGEPLCRDTQELAQLCTMVEKHLHRLHTDSRYARLWQRRALVLAVYRKLTARH